MERWLCLGDAQAFGARVLADLSSIIESQLEEMGEPDPTAEEIKKHKEFEQQRLEHFTGREDALQAIDDYLEGPINKVFAIIGASGTGKTSLMAKAMERAESRKGIKVIVSSARPPQRRIRIDFCPASSARLRQPTEWRCRAF